MKLNNLRIIILACVVGLLTGCSTPHPYTIKRGGFLEEKDYVAFQKLADKRPPIPWSKSWPNPSPKWSYSAESSPELRTFDRIAVPDLIVAPKGGPTATNAGAQNWTKDVGKLPNVTANQIAALLVAQKLVKEASRSGEPAPVTLVGALTFYHDGSALAGAAFGISSGTLSQDFMQTEFKLMVNGKQAGAIQVYAFRGKHVMGVMGMPPLERQIANGVVRALKEMKAGSLGADDEEVAMPDWFIK